MHGATVKIKKNGSMFCACSWLQKNSFQFRTVRFSNRCKTVVVYKIRDFKKYLPEQSFVPSAYDFHWVYANSLPTSRGRCSLRSWQRGAVSILSINEYDKTDCNYSALTN